MLPLVLPAAACILVVMGTFEVASWLGYMTAGASCLWFEWRISAEGEDQ